MNEKYRYELIKKNLHRIALGWLSNELVQLETRQTHFIKLVTFCLASLAYKPTYQK